VAHLSNWLYPNRLNPKAQLRVFCFPYSGASASIFLPWVNEVPEMIEICPVQLPGRGNRISEPLIYRLDEIVRCTLEGLSCYFDRPFIFFGHSFGALLSFELARLLRRTDKPYPLHLFVSGHGAPQLPDLYPKIHHLPHEELIEKLGEFNGMTREIFSNKELMEMIIPVIRADFEVCETYQYIDEKPLTIPISAYGGIEDPFVTRSDLESWQEQTEKKFMIRMFPGDHFYLNTSKNILLQALSREITKYI
jgi:medium-chain acyl-[acyl-carrier-protein] hydrolase